MVNKTSKITILVLIIMILSMIISFTACANQDDANSDIIIDVTKNDIIANNISKAKTNTSRINSLIANAAENSTIYFPEGIYYLDETINLTTFSRGVLGIINKKNITLLGKNATIINTAYDPTEHQNVDSYVYSRTLAIYNSTNVTIKNLSFDYLNYTQACGIITNISNNKTTIELFEEFTTDTNKPSLTGNEYIMAISTLDQYGAAISDYYASDDGYSGSLSNRNYIISGIFGHVGERAVIRFTLGSYAAPEFVVEKTNGLRIENVNSYSSPSATFYCVAGNSNFTFNNLAIAPKNESAELWGSNVDGIHIKGLRGNLSLKNCTFKGMGDDCLNVHSRAAKITAIDSATRSVTAIDGWDSTTLTENWAAVGDTVEIYDSNFNSKGTAIIESYYKGRMELSNLSSNISLGDFVQNRAYLPTTSIDNVLVDGGRARAFLIQTENVTIENCEIKNLALAGIIVSPDISYWYELGPSDNVVIKNNIFTNVCAMKCQMNYGAITVKARHDGGGETFKAGVHTNLTITGNTFNDIGSSALYVSATDGLTVSNNTINQYSINNYTQIASSIYAFAFVNCTKVLLGSNVGISNSNVYESNVTYNVQ